MPRKGDRHPPQCTRCTKPAMVKTVNGLMKGYFRCCEEHRNWHRIRGPMHPNARKKGRRLNDQGYVQVLDARKTSGSRYTLEHRLVMENKLGRPLAQDEVVHHLNGIRTDNREENLALISPGEKHESRTLIKALQARIVELESLLSSASA